MAAKGILTPNSLLHIVLKTAYKSWLKNNSDPRSKRRSVQLNNMTVLWADILKGKFSSSFNPSELKSEE